MVYLPVTAYYFMFSTRNFQQCTSISPLLAFVLLVSYIFFLRMSKSPQRIIIVTALISQSSFKEIKIIKNCYIYLHSYHFKCSSFLCIDPRFPSGITFLLPKGSTLPFLAMQLYWWWIFSPSVCLEKFLFHFCFVHIFFGYGILRWHFDLHKFAPLSPSFPCFKQDICYSYLCSSVHDMSFFFPGGF